MDQFMGKLKTFLGLPSAPPRNDFRNPIWGDDDDDDDELYDREAHMEVYSDPTLIHQELTRQMNEVMRSFGSIFADMGALFQGETFTDIPAIADHNNTDSDDFDSNSLRNHYLKPGYHNRRVEQDNGDIDLDGKISSEEISGMLKKKDGHTNTPATFDGSFVPGRSFCQTIITTSVTKPDGTVETHRIIKNGNEVTEETTTRIPGTGPKVPINTGLDHLSPDNIYQNVLSEFSKMWKIFH